MKLVRYGNEGQEKPGLLEDDGRICDLSHLVADIDGAALAPAMLQKIAAARLDLPQVEGTPRLGSCVARPINFVAVGLNYADHAKEIGMEFPKEPVIFQKASNCICGANDPIVIPRGSEKLDWEVEVGVVIGARASYVTEEQAMSHVAGFCLSNDVSERAFQLDRGGTWTKGKSAPSFGPLGPWLATADEIVDHRAIELWLEIDGERMQTGTTADMIFDCARIVSSISNYMVLEPGDVILTGTPHGVGQGRNPKRFLKAGEVVTLGGRGLGEQRQDVVRATV